MRRFAMFWLAAATLLLAGVPPAAAHFDAAGRYTHGRCPATPSTRVDPVNVVFTGWGTWGGAEPWSNGLDDAPVGARAARSAGSAASI